MAKVSLPTGEQSKQASFKGGQFYVFYNTHTKYTPLIHASEHNGNKSVCIVVSVRSLDGSVMSFC